MRIVTAQERLARRQGAHMIIVGEPGAGKTFQARMLRDQEGTVFVDGEAGTLALNRPIAGEDGQTIAPFAGQTIEGVRTWEHAQAIASLISGPDPTKDGMQPFSQAYCEAAAKAFPDVAHALAGASTVYWDSLTETSRACWDWVIKQPRAHNAKGAFDPFSAYRFLGDCLIELIKNIQRRADLNIIFACIMDPKDRDMQLIGQMAGKEIPGIFDTIVSLVNMVQPHGYQPMLATGAPPELPRFRAFVCRQNNPYGVPAKDRSGTLDMLEPPNLGALLAKMTGQ